MFDLFGRKKKTSSLSVVMSTKNRVSFLKDSIESILNQTFSDFNFIIIDDASTDDTFSILKKYQKQDNRIILHRNEHSIGPTKNYKRLMQLSDSPYMAHIDDDDISYPDRFQIQMDFVRNHPQYSFVGSYIDVIDDNNQLILYNWVREYEFEKLKFCMLFFNPFCHSSIIFNKDLLQKQDINYNIDWTYASDYEVYSQILLKGGAFCNIPQRLIQFRQHSNSITGDPTSVITQIYCAHKIRVRLLQNCGFSEKEAVELVKETSSFPFSDFSLAHIIKQVKIIADRAVMDGYSSEHIVNHFLNLLYKYKDVHKSNFFNIYAD